MSEGDSYMDKLDKVPSSEQMQPLGPQLCKENGAPSEAAPTSEYSLENGR